MLLAHSTRRPYYANLPNEEKFSFIFFCEFLKPLTDDHPAWINQLFTTCPIFQRRKYFLVWNNEAVPRLRSSIQTLFWLFIYFSIIPTSTVNKQSMKTMELNVCRHSISPLINPIVPPTKGKELHCALTIHWKTLPFSLPTCFINEARSKNNIRHRVKGDKKWKIFFKFTYSIAFQRQRMVWKNKVLLSHWTEKKSVPKKRISSKFGGKANENEIKKSSNSIPNESNCHRRLFDSLFKRERDFECKSNWAKLIGVRSGRLHSNCRAADGGILFFYYFATPNHDAERIKTKQQAVNQFKR